MRQFRWILLILLLNSLTGFSQYNPDSISFYYPDTTLNLERALLYIEASTGIYFSYNPGNLDLEKPLELSPGIWTLSELLRVITEPEDLQYTLIDDQVVIHRSSEMPLDSMLRTSPVEMPVSIFKGKVLGRSDKKPLAFSTIWVPSSWKGTIANAEGQFVLKIPEKEHNDSMAVSCMGYQTRIIPLSELEDSMNLIYLTESVIPIQEVIIRRTNPLTLIRQALKKTDVNHFRDPVIETAFYRESIQKDKRYISISEAVLHIYKPSIGEYSTEQVKVLKGRKNQDISETDTLLVKLRAGLRTCFLLDISRNPPDFLDPAFFSRFDYRMSDIITMQGKSTYVIDFKQNIRSEPPHLEGQVYIDLETLAFRGVNFGINPQTISRSTHSLVVRKPRNIRVRPISAEYQVRYKSDGGKFYVSLIRTDNRFRIREKGKLFGSEYRTVSEMAITQLSTEDVKRFRFRETTRIDNIFSDMLAGYNPGLWGQYNYMVPEEPIEDAIIRFNKIMGNSMPGESE